MTEQQPSVGRIVHVVDHKGECQAAIVTEVASPTIVSVTTFPARSSPYSERALVKDLVDRPTSMRRIAGGWHWPEVVGKTPQTEQITGNPEKGFGGVRDA